MTKAFSALLIASSLAAAGMPSAAHADDAGRVAAGAAGGFLGGLLLGGALSHPRPAPPYEAAPPGPVYYEPPPCHWEPGPRYWDDYEGVWRRRRIRVCD